MDRHMKSKRPQAPTNYPAKTIFQALQPTSSSIHAPFGTTRIPFRFTPSISRKCNWLFAPHNRRSDKREHHPGSEIETAWMAASCRRRASRRPTGIAPHHHREVRLQRPYLRASEFALPVLVRIHGSNWGGSMPRTAYLNVERSGFRHPMFEGLIVTSPICNIQHTASGLSPSLRQQWQFVVE
jgi:hypothetical protein